MSYQFNNINVLIIEDNLPLLEITKSLLGTFGVGHVITATNGKVGLEHFYEYNPDVVIADWMMKTMDGIEFTRRVRSNQDSPNPYVPIILMTGFSEKSRVIEARDAGVTEFLVKPFTARDLYKRLVQVIERPRQFVKSGAFFGPDRRRKREEEFIGPFRRDQDITREEARRIMQEKQNEAKKRFDDNAKKLEEVAEDPDWIKAFRNKE